MVSDSQLRFPVKRERARFLARLVPVLAMAMLVADLTGRAKVLEEVERETGKRPRPRIGLSFAEDEALLLPVEPLAQAEALIFFRQRLAMTKDAFDRLAKRYRHLAFFISRVESVGVIEQIQQVLDQALSAGQTRDQFVVEANRMLRAAGVDTVSDHHLETVFSNNVNTAYQTGRLHQMLQADVRRGLPYWRYATVGDSRVRPAHRAMHGFVARWDDPVWQLWTPPNGHRCRCSLFAISKADAKRRAAARGDDLDVPGLKRITGKPDEGFDQAPAAYLRGQLGEAR
jgi:SPP1 gp7 family putative phage head morphogenesis protein